MADNMDKRLDDEVLSRVSGGMRHEDASAYDAYGTVICCLGERQYLVRLEDSAEVKANFGYRHIVDEGTRVGLTATAGGWNMEELKEDW